MSAKYASIDELLVVLEWLMKQRPDSAYSRFCLFPISFDNPQILGSTFGAAAAMRRLNHFGAALASRVRHTDLVARDFCDFWILAPESNSDMVGCRLCEIAATAEQFGLDVVQCSIRAYVFPITHPGVTGARMLIDCLKILPPAYKFDPRRECGMDWLSKKADGTVTWSGKGRDTCARLRELNRGTSEPRTV